MKSIAISASSSMLDATLADVSKLAPQLVVLFAAPKLMRDAGFLAKIKAAAGKAEVVGCSTSGEISAKGVDEDTVTLTAVHFDKANVKATSTALANAAASYEAGRTLAAALNAPDLRGVFVLAPGLNVNGSELVKGISSALPPEVKVTGGLAGDGTDFKQTHTFINGLLSSDHVVAVGLYGDSLMISTGSQGGWKPFGPARRVTRVDGNVLYELDGKSALQLYKEYLGDKAAQLPASGLLYPFAILREDRSTSGLIRTILDVDHEKGSLTLAGDIANNSMVCLMHANTEALADGSTAAAEEAAATGTDADGLAILVSCVGRRLVMGQDVDDEVDAVRSVLGKTTPVIGFYSYGEICPSSETGKPELHNQTMTITYIRERKAA